MTQTLGEIAFETYQKAVRDEAERHGALPRFGTTTWDGLGEAAKSSWEEVGRSISGPTRTCAAHIASAKIALDELSPSRERSCVLTKLDEAEMWLERAKPIR